MEDNKSEDALSQKTCPTGACPLMSPFGLAAFFVGFMVIFYAERPYNSIGWIVVLLAYIKPLFRT
jgi:hypothetical protein